MTQAVSQRACRGFAIKGHITKSYAGLILPGLILPLLFVLAGNSVHPQEIPLDSCRQLPIVKATVDKRQAQFLVDTGAAATLLNLKSFWSPDSTEITMESWNGASAANGRKIVLRDFSIGEHQLANLTLLAVDLTPLERSCQKRLDGVLGADLIARLGLTIDLKNRIGILDGEARSAEARFHELQQQQTSCEQAFNRSDEKAFADCLAPDVVVLTSKGDYHGRNSVMKHFKESYFGQDPPVVISMAPRSQHAIGNVIWTEYEMSVNFRGQVIKHRGTAIYQKTGQKWVMSNMNYASAQPEK
jgi:ketosteroid isomerase-like protein